MKKSVNTIINNSAGKYLLQVRDGAEGICNPLKWNFFGGGISDNEDPIAAATRETNEELEIKTKPGDFELLGEIRPSEGKIVYIPRYQQPLEWKDITIQEGAGAGYFTKNELLKIDITDATRLIVKQYL